MNRQTIINTRTVMDYVMNEKYDNYFIRLCHVYILYSYFDFARTQNGFSYDM